MHNIYIIRILISQYNQVNTMTACIAHRSLQKNSQVNSLTRSNKQRSQRVMVSIDNLCIQILLLSVVLTYWKYLTYFFIAVRGLGYCCWCETLEEYCNRGDTATGVPARPIATSLRCFVQIWYRIMSLQSEWQLFTHIVSSEYIK